MTFARTRLVPFCFLALVQSTAVGHAGSFCGSETAAPDALLQTVKGMTGIKEIHRDREFVAFQEPGSSAVYTFTEPAHAAHPAAICRKPVQKGDQLEIEMAIVCKGPDAKCGELEQDFKLLNAKMQADINNQINARK